MSATYNRPYYFNRTTQVTQWTFPTLSQAIPYRSSTVSTPSVPVKQAPPGSATRWTGRNYDAVPPPSQNKNVIIVQGTDSSTPDCLRLKHHSNVALTTSGNKNSAVDRSKWPPSLRAYMTRAFEACRTDEENTKMEQELRKIINRSIKENRLWTSDWSTLSLPSIRSTSALESSGATMMRGTNGSRREQSNISQGRGRALTKPAWMTSSMPERGSIGVGRGRDFTKPAWMTHPGKVVEVQKKEDDRELSPTRWFQTDQEDSERTEKTKKRKKKSKRKGKKRKSTTPHPLRSQIDALRNKRKNLGPEEASRRSRRRRRFERSASEEATSAALTIARRLGQRIQDSRQPVVGTNTTLEKSYFRLTSAPAPCDVRPLRILRKALDMVLDKISRGCDYLYACDQFKSIRQDLTVQHVQNDFTVMVYESHARVALDNSDMNEFNQCQTQLIELYRLRLPGSVMEFTAYRLMYHIYSCNDSNVYQEMTSMRDSTRRHSAVATALRVRRAVALNDYVDFFGRCHDEAVELRSNGLATRMIQLYEMLVPAFRCRALSKMVKAYRPSIALRLIRETLRFESDARAREWVVSVGGQFLDGGFVDVRSPFSHMTLTFGGGKLL